MLRHCPYCFRLPLRDVEKHIALCKANKDIEPLTIPEITHVLRNLLERVDAQEKLIQKLRGVKTTFPPECVKPELTDADLQTFLREGIDAVVAKHTWPLFVIQKKPYVFDNEWREASTEDVLVLVDYLMKGLTSAFDRLVSKMGWLDDDPHGRFPQTSSAVYGLTASQVKTSLLKLCV